MSKRFFPAVLAVGLFSATVSVQAATIEFSNVINDFKFVKATDLWVGSFTVNNLVDNSGVTLTTGATLDTFDPFLVVWEVLDWDGAGNPLTGRQIGHDDDFFGPKDSNAYINLGSLSDGTYYFAIGNTGNAPSSNIVDFNDLNASFTFSGPNPNVLYPHVSYGDWSVTVTGVVPEPETWAMLLAGLGIVGSIARRRRAH